ncbi:MAG: hypothetical protein JO071_02515 [Deltaproteobacteria bacterium]|nr:hypothetical protein [Deltaproteobacteria bacterium]
MPELQQEQNYLELFDISKKTAIAKVPLAAISHLPRTGERIFLPLHRSGDWEAYTVMAVEYFVGGEPSASGGPLESPGMVRVTLYVERSD